MQAKSHFFNELQRGLIAIERAEIMTQLEIAAATGVDQPTISRAKSGTLKRQTAKLERLKSYVDMQIVPTSLPARIEQASLAFLASGGTAEELAVVIRTATALVRGHR